MFDFTGRKMKKTAIRFVAAAGAIVMLLSSASCSLINRPPVTDPVTDPVSDPITDPVQSDKAVLQNTVFTLSLLKGDIPGPFSETSKIVYVTMGIPEGMGGGYRQFKAQSSAVSARTGFSLITADDIINFNSKYTAIQATENTLFSLRPELQQASAVLMDADTKKLENGATLSVFYTFTKVSGEGVYEAYCYLLSADGMSVFPFVCKFNGYSAFKNEDVRARIEEMAASVKVEEDAPSVDLSEGLVSRRFSLYDNMPAGLSVVNVRKYEGDYLAIFATNRQKTLYVGFFDYKNNTLVGDFEAVAENTTLCEVYEAQNGLTVCYAYGKYNTVMGTPGDIEVKTITKTFSEAIYSEDGKYRAYVQASNGNVIIEKLETGRSIVAFSPREASVESGKTQNARLFGFMKDGRLIFTVHSGELTDGFGVYSPSDETLSLYQNGLTPLGCTAEYMWCLRYENSVYTEICRAPLDSLEGFVPVYKRDGEREEGFFDNYEDIFFESRITMNASGTYFVLFPADDASRISLFTTSNYKCVYTTPVPQISEVISLDKHIVVGTQGWGSLYTIDLPEKTTPGGSFDPDTVTEEPNYTPSYSEVLEQLYGAAPYFYKPANGAGALASSNIIYYLLGVAADRGLGEEYIDYPYQLVNGNTDDEETAVTELVTDTAEPATEPATEPAISDPRLEGVKKYKVQIYTLKVLAWELLGIREDYFDRYITEPLPEIADIITEPITDEVTEPATDEITEAVTDEQTDATADNTEPVTDEVKEPEIIEIVHENAYIGLEEGDWYERETGYFYFTPHENQTSGWQIEIGGSYITQKSNTLAVKTVLVAPDGTRMNAEYCYEAINDYYRLVSVTVSTSLNVTQYVPDIYFEGKNYRPLWYAVEKGANKVYYPLTKSGVTLSAVARHEKSDSYKNAELVFGDAHVYGMVAAVSVCKSGVYDTLIVDVLSGESRMLSGEDGFKDFEGVIKSMYSAKSSYPYYAARLLGAAQNGSRILYLVSDQVNTLAAKYYVYDLVSGQSAVLCSSLSGARASITKTEYFEWIGASRVRISVFETVGTKLKNNVYEFNYSAGKWVKNLTDYTTDGTTWYANGTVIPEKPEDSEDINKPDDPDHSVTEFGGMTEEEVLAAFTDESGYTKDDSMSLEEIRASYLEARKAKIAQNSEFDYIGISRFVITYRSSGYIMLTEYAEYYNDRGEPVGHTRNCQNVCQKVNGEWTWTKITLP